MKYLLCDICGEMIEIGNHSGIVTFDKEYDADHRKHLSNFHFRHKLFTGHSCDSREQKAWRPIEELTGKDGLAHWLDLLDPKYNHGEDNTDAQFVTVDLSCIEAMMRCLIPGYDEARHFSKQYGYEVNGASREPIITADTCKEILNWVKKQG